MSKIPPVKNNVILELHVPEFQPARNFYSLFGFEELSYDPTSGGGSDLGYLALIRHDTVGDTLINFYGDKEKVAQHAHFKDFPTNTPRGYGVEITIPVSDVQQLWKQIVDTVPTAALSQPLTMKRWGKQDFRLTDLYGFYVRFTEPVDWEQNPVDA